MCYNVDNKNTRKEVNTMFNFKKSKKTDIFAPKGNKPTPKTPIQEIDAEIEALGHELYLGNTDPEINIKIAHLQQKRATLVRAALQTAGIR